MKSKTINCMTQESLDDLRYELELKNAEIDELSMELQEKIEEINKDIKNKKSHLRLIESTREYIGGLLHTQVKTEDE